MAKTKIILNGAGVRSLLKSPEMQAILEGHAAKIAGKAGGKHEVYVAETRAVARISGDDGENSILKAVKS